MAETKYPTLEALLAAVREVDRLAAEYVSDMSGGVLAEAIPAAQKKVGECVGYA